MFWLVLLAAIGIGWELEHRRLAEPLPGLRNQYDAWRSFTDRFKPTHGALERVAALARLRGLTDEQLSARLAKLLTSDAPYRYHADYQPCLTEMARRGLKQELQKQYDALMAAPRRSYLSPRLRAFPDNLELLTALRRAAGQPDPLKIQVELRNEERQGEPSPIPHIVATLENVDIEQESVYMVYGGDYRGGRPEHWRVQLTTTDGEKIPDSNMPTVNMGGLSSFGPLAYGEKGKWPVWLDPRCFVQSPPSGRYQVQVFHCRDDIASEPDLSGMILWKSEPLTVEVENRSLADARISVLPLLAILSIGGVLFALTSLRRLWNGRHANATSRKLFGWRDLLAVVLVAALTAGWLLDIRHLRAETLKVLQDKDADWSLKLVD